MILFETHSTSTDNEAGIASGHHDPPLSELGRQQARELGARYAGIELAVVCCSDLQRSYSTAEIAFAGRNIPITRDARLRECNYGTMTATPASEIKARQSAFIHQPFPGGESYEDVVARMRAFLLQETRRPMLIIGHRATWYALETLLNGIPLEETVSRPWVWQPGWRYLTSSSLHTPRPA